MEPKFDVYVSGELLDGFEQATVVKAVAELFKLDEAAAGKLVDGQQRRVKSDCDKATALKYRVALSNAGLKVSVQRHGATPQAKSSGAESSATDAAEKAAATSAQLSAIAAEAEKSPVEFAARDVGEVVVDYQSTGGPDDDGFELTLAPVGAMLTNPDDKPEAPQVNAPEFGLAPAGDPIPMVEEEKVLLNPDTTHLDLSPAEPG